MTYTQTISQRNQIQHWPLPKFDPAETKIITKSQCVHELFESQVDRRPDARAIVSASTSMTYIELERAANRLAHFLRENGIGPGSLVGLFMERSIHPIIAILGCLKAGAAYVPIDPILPEERIRFIVKEAETSLLITDNSLAARAAAAFEGDLIILDSPSFDFSKFSTARLTQFETGLCPEDLCYVIYTSGTTGRPKGVMTEHRNAYEYVLAFNDACSTGPEDRIYQGFSLSFDGSIEEIWMAFSNGAALVVGDKCTPKFGNDVAAFLNKHQVTYLSTVPTMLSTMTDAIPSLRQLVVSGEVCPPELVQRWARPGLTMLNVYGPTEATVNTTFFECLPNKPITIGRPITGYSAHILDENLQVVATGEEGELFVGGPGVARGYFKQPELTAQKFLTVELSGFENPLRLYRTGDLVRMNADGEIEFFGRLDGQVKIRGFRVELSEIESVLREHDSISTAAVKLVDREGMQELAAFVTLRQAHQPLDRNEVLMNLRARLPVYMIPSYLDVLPVLPTLASGKTDRKALPPPSDSLIRSGEDLVLPSTNLEKEIAEVWSKVFRLKQISVVQNFFTDLGGHSLLAAQMVTLLRSKSETDLAVRDVYHSPTVRALAAKLEERTVVTKEQKHTSNSSSKTVFESTSKTTRGATAALQAAGIYTLLGLVTIPATAAFILLLKAFEGSIALEKLIYLFAIVGIMTWPVMLTLSIAAKWILIGRYRVGSYPLWSFYYLRWWMATRMQALSGAGMLSGTPLMPWYYRMMGAKVGQGCSLETMICGAWDLLSIGEGTSIGPDTQLSCYRVENGMLHLGTIEIGKSCFIGAHSALGLNVAMDDQALLDDQSLLPDGSVMPYLSSWRGSPAVAAKVEVPLQATSSQRPLHPSVFASLQFILLYVQGITLGLPGILFLGAIVGAYVWGALPLAISVAVLTVPSAVVVYCFWIAALKSVVLRKAKPGVYPMHSWFHLRKWYSDGLMSAARALMLPVYTTIFLPSWLRLLGAKIGPRAEMSAVWRMSPESLVVGPESFFADGCILGGKRTYQGLFEISEINVGRRTFIGNSAILPTGTNIGNGCLLGVLSAPPSNVDKVADGTEWLGSPAFPLPNRQKVASFADHVIFTPTRKLFAQRVVIDTLRILIPGTIGLLLTILGIAAVFLSYKNFGSLITLLAAPLFTFALSLVAIAAVVALKWTVMGRFKPVVVPLWSMYVWLNEMVNGAYESVMAPAISTYLGTPFIAPFLRLLGCKIGKNTYIESTLFSEFDLIEVGDYAALNAGAIIQTHLFEDRIMKSSYLKIGDEATVGNIAVVLYDATMERGARLGPLSLLMKGETLREGSSWHGIPTVRI